ncbi:hypothetical protein [Meiothermus sp.]|uniref:hypothetical protein n=1 Tax=Meiothermus sp. TaxID=1955249 RepID=UPI0021DF078C|nr:hypothetical protein [Meiothermus sp.]GIW32868.1 MAG: hypothetical protein KatS3mg072_0201 [Meiothermus sp.]
MTPWRVLIQATPQLVDKLRRVNPPKLRLVVDGEVVYWALLVPKEADLEAHSRWPGMPSPGLGGWLLGILERYEAAWPEAGVVELLAYWPPDRLEPFAKAYVRRKQEAA